MEVLDGETAIETNAAALTVNRVLPVTPFKLAEIVDVPVATVEAKP